MSQQLLIWSISPFMIQQLESEGVMAFEIFWNADEEFNPEEDLDIELSETVKLNAEAILQEAMNAEERACIEIQGGFASIVHFLLSGEDNSDTLTGPKAVDSVVWEETVNENIWLLVNALVGKQKVKAASDYIASFLTPEETQNVSVALTRIGTGDFEARSKDLSCKSQEKRVVVNDTEIHMQLFGKRQEIALTSEAEEFINSELIPLYSSASKQGYGILIAWSI